MATKEALVRYGPNETSRFRSTAELIARIQNSESDRAVHQMKQPLLLGLWTDGYEKPEDVHHGAAQRRFTEIAARQRLLGPEIVYDSDVSAAFAAMGNFREPSTIVVAERS